MKTTDLTDEKLDYWVAKAIRYMDGHEFRLGLTPETAIMLRTLETGADVKWQPSVDWAQGGPIIERERIELVPNIESRWTAEVDPYNYRHGPGQAPTAFADTPLIAAMRAFVASRFGEEVPDQP